VFLVSSALRSYNGGVSAKGFKVGAIGRNRVRMKSWRSLSLPEGRLDRPYIESVGQVTVERWVLPTRVVESPREREASKLDRQSILSCLGVIVRSSMVVFVVDVILLPTSWHGVA
jgi:hypothetical protein